MSDYADAVRDWNPVAEAAPLRFPPAVVQPAALPAAMQPEPQVYQPVPIDVGRPNPWQDPWVVRPIALGVCIALAGEGVNLFGQGVRTAGPYLWAAAAFMGALAAVIAFAKGHGAPPGSGGTTVNIHGNRNRVGNIR